MWAVRIRDYVSPHLPTCPGSDALPVTKKLVMADVIDLPADQLSIALHVPATQATDARQIADLRITLVPGSVTWLVVNAQNEVVEAVCRVPKEPGAAPHPRPKDTILGLALPMSSISIARVVGSLEPIKPIWKPTVFVDKAGKNRR